MSSSIYKDQDAKYRCSAMCIVLVLLVCASRSTEARPPVRPTTETRRNLALLLDQAASNRPVAKETIARKVLGNTKEIQNNQPNRVSPGGPDPHHHFVYLGLP
ncbi:hypothetical protein F2P56_009641 [Juglans regia]|uniref:Uncharacterized protein n=1 Tax=Juglans regia TaxID=51240 RepID=A0A834CWQ3_JUGRE|nr:hypothetical protein F2P56_009641 [Juglans regia]